MSYQVAPCERSTSDDKGRDPNGIGSTNWGGAPVMVFAVPSPTFVDRKKGPTSTCGVGGLSGWIWAGGRNSRSKNPWTVRNAPPPKKNEKSPDRKTKWPGWSAYKKKRALIGLYQHGVLAVPQNEAL